MSSFLHGLSVSTVILDRPSLSSLKMFNNTPRGHGRWILIGKELTWFIFYFSFQHIVFSVTSFKERAPPVECVWMYAGVNVCVCFFFF